MDKVENFGAAFHDGLALCGIIYKHRPKLIPNFPTMKKDTAKDNLRVAMDASEQYHPLSFFSINEIDETKILWFGEIPRT